MTTYAPVPVFAQRRRHPRALILILGGHAALLAAVMTAKMDVPVRWDPTRTDVTLIPVPPDPAQAPPQSVPKPKSSVIDRVPAIVPAPSPSPPILDDRPLPIPVPDTGPIIGGFPGPAPDSAPVRKGPRFETPDSLVEPPYPDAKLRSGEEAVLRLRLSIDARGRVAGVEPVGRADPVFLAAARRHILAHWRYQPASEDGRAVASTTVVTLRFKLTD